MYQRLFIYVNVGNRARVEAKRLNSHCFGKLFIFLFLTILIVYGALEKKNYIH